MEAELLSNISTNVRSLRDMWSAKTKQEEKLLKPKLTASRSYSTKSSKNTVGSETRCLASMESIVVEKQSNLIPANNPSALRNSLSVHDKNESLSFPELPPSCLLEQVPTDLTLHQSVMQLFDVDRHTIFVNHPKKNSLRHWHLARHVFRSGLIFSASRRASDSIVPVLMKTSIVQTRRRTESLDSTQTPFQTLIGYISQNYDENNDVNLQMKKQLVKRTVSDTMACIQRNKLNDTIAQYEAILRHLKNYDKFMATYPISNLSVPAPKSPNNQETIKKHEEFLQQTSSNKSSRRCSQTQSLARCVGRTFTEFIINDLLSSEGSQASTNAQQLLNLVSTASQTDCDETYQTVEVIPSIEVNQIINELDKVLDNTDQDPQITANSEINVVIVNSASPTENEYAQTIEKPLMQRLFENKKTAYTPEDLYMKPERIPAELMETYQEAKTTCFFTSEKLLYATKMIKIDRRGYKQRLRILAITTERLYIITKKNPYPKEQLLFKDLLGVYCTPYKDGFICLKTKEVLDDRGDWIFLVNHPCEFITQLFMALRRDNNNDNFLRIEPKFQHTRRATGALNDDVTVEARLAPAFHMKYENYEVLAIYTP